MTANDADVGRVRSASEAFLLKRLQDNPATRDRFRSNAHLPIPFCERGDMEVDFLDADARVVIELDGPQHLSDPDAYRRDRRKDALLQENGYLVLRFLAEDLGTRLNDVLDEILRALANRMRSGARPLDSGQQAILPRDEATGDAQHFVGSKVGSSDEPSAI